MQLPNEIEAFARELLDRANQRKLPVNIHSIATLIPRMSIRQRDMVAHGYYFDHGRLLGREIVVRRQDSPRQKRFTTAHEIGHWSLQQISLLRGDRDSQVASSEPCGPRGHPLVETWCDRFAASLLMPREIVEDRLQHANPEQFALKSVAWAREFDVSISAMIRRIVDLRVASVFISRRGGERQLWANREAPLIERKAVLNELMKIEDTARSGGSITPRHVDNWTFSTMVERHGDSLIVIAVRL